MMRYYIILVYFGTSLARELPPSSNASIAVICSLLIPHLNYSFGVCSISHPSFLASLICLVLSLPLGAAGGNGSIWTCDKHASLAERSRLAE